MAKPLFFVLLALLFYFSPLNIQGQGKADSLYAELKKAQSDTCRVNIYNELCSELVFPDLKQAISNGKKGLQLALKNKYAKGVANACQNLGTCYCPVLCSTSAP